MGYTRFPNPNPEPGGNHGKQDHSSPRPRRQTRRQVQPGKGPDIKTDKITINVETANTLPSACLRLRGFRGPVYIACANDKDIPDARYWTEGKTVGIMNNKGRVLKKSSRGRWP